MPIVFERVRSAGSGELRRTGEIVRGAPRTAPRTEVSDAWGARSSLFGAAGLSFAQPEAMSVAATATAKVVRERRRIVAILLSVTALTAVEPALKQWPCQSCIAIGDNVLAKPPTAGAALDANFLVAHSCA